MKKLLLLVTLSILSVVGFSQTWDVQYVSTSAANSGGANTATISNIPYPSSLQAGNVLLMTVSTRAYSTTSYTDRVANTPVGWKLLTFGGGPNGYLTCFTRVVTGSENGTFSVSYPVTNTEIKLAVIHQFSNVAYIGDRYSGVDGTTAYTGNNAKSEVDGSKVISILYSNVSANVGVYTGGNVTWTEPVQEYKTTINGGSTLGLNMATVTNGVTITDATQPLLNTTFKTFILKARQKTEFVNAGTPVYLAAGSPHGSGTVLPVPYPANCKLGNLLLLVATTRLANVYPVGPPAGWRLLASNGTTFVYCRYAYGTETGSVNIVYNTSTTNNRNGRIYQFQSAGAVAHALNTYSSLNTATAGSMTNSYSYDLAVSFIYSTHLSAINTYSGGALTWTEPLADFRGLSMNIAPYSTTVISSGVATQPVVNVTTLNFVLKYPHDFELTF